MCVCVCVCPVLKLLLYRWEEAGLSSTTVTSCAADDTDTHTHTHTQIYVGYKNLIAIFCVVLGLMSVNSCLSLSLDWSYKQTHPLHLSVWRIASTDLWPCSAAASSSAASSSSSSQPFDLIDRWADTERDGLSSVSLQCYISTHTFTWSFFRSQQPIRAAGWLPQNQAEQPLTAFLSLHPLYV